MIDHAGSVGASCEIYSILVNIDLEKFALDNLDFIFRIFTLHDGKDA